MKDATAAGVAFLALLPFLLPGSPRDGKLPVRARAELDKVSEFELFSLTPQSSGGTDSFHSWQVLGKTTVKESRTREALLGSLEKSITTSDRDGGARCFEPRHAI